MEVGEIQPPFPASLFIPMKKTISNLLFYSSMAVLLFVALCQIGVFPWRFIYIRSGSMRPTYQPGDLAFVYISNDLNVNPGDIVLFSATLGPTIHRVISIENGMISTQGDANSVIDSQKINQVDGKVLFAIPKLGYAINFIQGLSGQIAKNFP